MESVVLQIVPVVMEALGLWSCLLEPQTPNLKPRTFPVFSVAYSMARGLGRGWPGCWDAGGRILGHGGPDFGTRKRLRVLKAGTQKPGGEERKDV